MYYWGPAINNNFGYSVAFNYAGDRLAIGCSYYDVGLTDRGAVYIFHYNYTTSAWPGPFGNVDNVTSKTYYIGDSTNNYFGYSVALNAAGDRLAVSSPYYLSNRGTFYVYHYDYANNKWPGTNGALANANYVLSPNGEAANDIFGFYLAFNAAGDRLIVGAKGVSSNTGAIYVYDYNYNLTAWATSYTSKYIGDTASGQFGTSVAINSTGTMIAAGAGASAGNYVKIITYGTNTIVSQNVGTLSVKTVAGGRGTQNIFATSSDGLSWSNSVAENAVLFNGTSTTPRICNALAASSSLFVAGGGPTTTNTLAWSADSGDNWYNSLNGTATYPFSGGVCQALAWNGSKWVAGGVGTNPLAYSYDGQNWFQSANGTGLFSGGQCSGITWNGTNWLAGGNGSTIIAYSSNGITWQSMAYNLNNPLAITSRRVALNAPVTTSESILLEQTIGYTQKWINVTTVRAATVTYYNTTGRPIMVSITGPHVDKSAGDFSNMSIYVNGNLAATGYYGNIDTFVVMSAIVPVNSAYYFTNTGKASTLSTFLNWYELR